MWRHSLILLALLIQAGCAVGPDYVRPDIVTPDGWRIDHAGDNDLANTDWWSGFNDPNLDKLIGEALENNKDLRIAAARVEQFSARLGISHAEYYPQIGYGASAGRERLSENRAIPIPSGTSRTNDTYEINANANWELDLWGRIRRSNEAARAELLASEENRHAIIMTLISDLAAGYVRLLSLDKQLEISRRTVDSRAESLRIFEQKYSGGSVSALELAQAKSLYEEVAAAVPDIERRIVLLENSISLLLGRNPGAIARSRSIDALQTPPVPGGLPSDILARRPDIRQAEQELIAANARIGVAKSQYFPSISLTGLLGYASTELDDVANDASGFGAIGGSVIGRIFTGGRIRNQIRESEALQHQLLVKYLQTVQTAFLEVENALISHQKTGDLIDIDVRRVGALQDYLRLAKDRYEGGHSGYLEVLDAERSLYDAEIIQVERRTDSFAALIAIYKAMGGGWPIDGGAETAARDTAGAPETVTSMTQFTAAGTQN